MEDDMGGLKGSLRGLLRNLVSKLSNALEIAEDALSKEKKRISDEMPSWGEAKRSKIEWLVTHEDGTRKWFKRRKDAFLHYKNTFFSSDIIRVETTSEGFVIDERKIK